MEDMAQDTVIEVRNLYKQFKIRNAYGRNLKSMFIFHRSNGVVTNQVLQDISLDIHHGETVALIGTNGSGKSTLLKLMTKIIYPTKGTVKTYGKLTSLLELGAGFHPDFTGRENIYFNASIFGLSRKEIDERIEEIIQFSELGSFIDEPIRTYSSGMYMRLAFSIAINVDAEILLIDEILAVGDQHFQDKCFAKLKDLKANGKTIVIVSHSLEVVKDLCTRAIWIYHGKARLDGDPTYVVDEYLKQVAIDHKEAKKQELAKGIEKYRGIIFFDEPQNYVRIKDKLSITGWKLTDCEDAYFELRIGDRTIHQVEDVKRQDVAMVYEEQFLGFMDVERIGFHTEIDVQEYASEIQSGNELYIHAFIFHKNGNVIAQKNCIVLVGKE